MTEITPRRYFSAGSVITTGFHCIEEQIHDAVDNDFRAASKRAKYSARRNGGIFFRGLSASVAECVYELGACSGYS